MQTITSTQAKNQFWEMLDTVISEPVSITRRWRKLAYVVSARDFEDMIDGFMASKIEEKWDFLSVNESKKILDKYR